MASEDDLIKRISRVFAARQGQVRVQGESVRKGQGQVVAPVGAQPRFVCEGGLPVGIGDDAAVMRFGDGKVLVVTTDAFLENVHFLRGVHPPDAVGYKALARATSDIAAMGARPRYFLLTLGIPQACTGAWLDSFLKGMAGAARQFSLTLAGGDTTRYPEVVVSLTVAGEIEPGLAVLRSGAKPGDLLCVSGTLGEAELGLRLALKGSRERKQHANSLRKHLYPEPRLALAQWLAENRIASAMIDTSDGLSTDLGHLCKASGVGARVWAEKIPLTRIPMALKKYGLDPAQFALHCGEDYELLFTVPKSLTGRLPREMGGVPVTIIGEIIRQKKILLVDAKGKTRPLRPGGWDPFGRR